MMTSMYFCNSCACIYFDMFKMNGYGKPKNIDLTYSEITIDKDAASTIQKTTEK